MIRIFLKNNKKGKRIEDNNLEAALKQISQQTFINDYVEHTSMAVHSASVELGVILSRLNSDDGRSPNWRRKKMVVLRSPVWDIQ